MNLPILENPIFIGTVPSTGQKFEFRPFLVKEQKILLMALEADDMNQIFVAFKDIFQACIRSKEIDFDSMPSFDVESLFLQIASKSVGEVSELLVPCTNCKEPNKIGVNMENTSVKNIEEYKGNKNIIQLNDTVGMKLKFPSAKDLMRISADDNKSDADLIYDTLLVSIESIFDANNVYPADESTEAELREFIDSFSFAQMKKVEQFFDKTPYLALDCNFTCTKCGTENKQEIKGLKSFF
jgi:hypothetical protein